MRKLSILLVTSLLVINTFAQKQPAARTSTPAKAGAVAGSLSQIKIPQLHAFHPQQPKRIQLDNGLVIFLQEDHELPLIDGSARIRGGGRDVPAEKAGMMSVYGSSWRTGGTKSRTGDHLDDFLEARAAKVETGGSGDSTNISFSALKGDIDDVFNVFVELLRGPEFRQDKVDLAKRNLSTSISRRNDEINEIASREARKIGYGSDNPYARVPEYWTVAATTREDLLAWHKTHVHPNNIIIGIVGDFDSVQMEKKLRSAFGSWPKGPAFTPTKIDFKAPPAGVYFAPKEDVNQSAIQLITLGTTRNNPDYFAISVMNELFGGGFSSRLFSNIRSRKGLAYSVGGGIGTDFDHPGLFRLAMSTKSQSTAEAITALQTEISDLIKDPGSAEEVQRAKDNILSGFVFEFDSKEKILQERIAYEFYGYPPDFIEQYRAGVEKITPADIARVVQKYVAGKQFATLVVGNDKEFDKPLSAFGPVHPIDITIKDSPGSSSPAQDAKAGAPAASAALPTASNPEGKALIAKIVAAMGGAEKLQTVKAVASKADQTRKGPQGDMQADLQTLSVYPDKTAVTMGTPFGEVKIVISPEASFMSFPGRPASDMPGGAKEEALKDMKREPLWVAQHAGDPKYIFTANGTAKVDDTNAAVLDINADGAASRWYVDPAKGELLRAEFKSGGMQGPVERQVDYSDYRDVNGIRFAFKRITRDNGEVAAQTTVKEITINPPVDAAVFKKPAQ